MTLTVRSSDRSYDIIVERGSLGRAAGLLNLDRKLLIVTDDGVPQQYPQAIASQAAESYIFTLPRGERSKSPDNFTAILDRLKSLGFRRGDCIISVGGGMVGDISGYAASSYMRGISWYNIPTTLLSQVDSSIGGKTAINFGGVKNLVGAFYQPDAVLIDPDVLTTLSERLFNEGVAEIIKMAATSDADLFDRICLSEDIRSDIESYIEAAIRIKRSIVEADPLETGLRRVLNFGHTVGHAIEAAASGRYLHGECVAMGMLCFCSPQLRSRLRSVFALYGLPSYPRLPANVVMDLLSLDKKSDANGITVVYVDAPGSFELRHMEFSAISEIVRRCCHPEIGERNVVLIGMPSSGKSTLGKRLSAAMGREFFDSDAEVEAACGKRVREVFAEEGEAHFRKLEKETVHALAQKRGAVIATGGGVVLDPDNMSALMAHGLVFLLDCPLSELEPTADRPLASTQESLARLYDGRRELYLRYADVIVSPDGLDDILALA